jgi:hypothetical protein
MMAGHGCGCLFDGRSFWFESDNDWSIAAGSTGMIF